MGSGSCQVAIPPASGGFKIGEPYFRWVRHVAFASKPSCRTLYLRRILDRGCPAGLTSIGSGVRPLPLGQVAAGLGARLPASTRFRIGKPYFHWVRRMASASEPVCRTVRHASPASARFRVTARPGVTFMLWDSHVDAIVRVSPATI
ncbi:hypothetical protein MRB53_033047 [Persea americana]|uniref:Uncharacterized protein n=1 Tax=Persea americana TaxID=3435 RepID=A0ACC2KTV2_PERAE|nr:hypothetical protein MRB53_033047 [Persea americana]